jgi:hypothetical protein
MIGDADLKCLGFSLWVLGRQFPESDDYWDGNWLTVRVRVEAPGALVEHTGSFLRTDELREFFRQVGVLDTALTGDAVLSCMEPTLGIALKFTQGHGDMTVAITPDHMTQSHRFEFSLDQTYLKPLLADCQAILSKWPVVSIPGS